jgi:hypothetical protein
VLFRTGRWIHRALVSPTGLIWTDTIRAPKAMHGSQMVFGQVRGPVATPDETAGDQSGERVLILESDSGVTKLAEVRFSYADGPALFGSKAELLSEWTEKIRGPAVSAFVREGF